MFFIKDVNFNINRTGSMRVARNKALTYFFLEQFGYKIPVYSMVYTDKKCQKFNLTEGLQSGIDFAHKIGYPIIMKINDSSQGRGVYKIFNDTDFLQMAELIFQSTNMFQIQKFYDYRDYRVVVLGDNVISAYERIPLQIIGDGIHTIEYLLYNKQKQYSDSGRVIDIYDNDTVKCLTRLNYTFDTVLASGNKVVLRDVSNLSAGGECRDFTEQIHPDFANLCISIVKDLNLDLCGVDIMCPDISKALTDYVILEVNSAPGLDNYAFSEETQSYYVKELYRQVILYLKEIMK